MKTLQDLLEDYGRNFHRGLIPSPEVSAFHAGAAAMASLFAAQPVSVTLQQAAQPAPGSGGPQWLTPEQQENMRANGLDPAKEFGAFDPRAERPRCVHGKFFTEDCEECDAKAAQQDHAQQLSAGTEIDGT
jgi:hypothetical protein